MRKRINVTTLAMATLIGAVLGACASTQNIPPDESSDAGAAFLACLTSAGVEARINDSGQILVKRPAQDAGSGSGVSIGSSGDGALGMEGDENGDTWVVAADSDYFQDDPDTQDAYAACEADHPGFTQPDQNLEAENPELEAEEKLKEEAALAFARCGRDNGYTSIEDPDFTKANSLILPPDLTEDEFRALVVECLDPEAPVFNTGQSADASFEAWAVIEEFLETTP